MYKCTMYITLIYLLPPSVVPNPLEGKTGSVITGDIFAYIEDQKDVTDKINKVISNFEFQLV